jgi:hypothetical protein
MIDCLKSVDKLKSRTVIFPGFLVMLLKDDRSASFFPSG